MGDPATNHRRVPTRTSLGVARLAPVLVCSTPLLLGGATPSTHALVVALVLACAIAVVSTAREVGLPHGARIGAWLFAAMTFVAFVQTLPLPCSWADALGGDQRGRFVSEVARALAPGAGPRCTIALDPGAGYSAAAGLAAMLAAYLVGATSATRLGSARAVLAAVASGAAAVCVVTLVHEVLGEPRVYGTYLPAHADYGLVGPLLNGNHLALFASLGFLAGSHLVLVERTIAIRIAAALAAAICAMTVVATHSRGGIVSLGASVVALLLVAARSRAAEGRLPSTAERLVLAAIALATVAVVALEWDAIAAEFRFAPFKTSLIATALGTALDSGALGFGRGGFAAGYAPVSSTSARAMHAENFVAQWANEYGVVLGAAFALAAIALVVRGLRDRRSRSSSIAAAGVGIVLLHELGDFAIELVAVGSVFGLLLGASMFRSGGSSKSRHDFEDGTRVRALRFSVGFALLASIVGLGLGTGRSLETSLARARSARIEGRVRDSDAILRAALVDHPFEPGLFLELTANAVGRSDDQALRWANFTSRRAPSWHGQHLALAEHFFRRGRNAQALAELARVETIASREVAETLCRYEPRRLEPARVARAIPDRGDIVEMANVLRRCMSTARFLAILDAAIESGSRDPSLERLAIETVAGAEGGEAAERRYLVAERRHPQNAVVLLTGARVAIGNRNGALALDRARRADRAGAEVADAASTLARAATIADDERARDRALARLRHELEAGRLAPEYVAVVEAECAELDERPDLAIEAYERAYEAAPSPALLVHVETIARRTGRLLRADQAIRLLCRDFPDEERCATPRNPAERMP